MRNLKGKVALVTGAAGKQGIGRAIALRLAKAGADVVINDVAQFDVRRSDDDRVERWRGLKDVAAEIKAMGRKAKAIEADIGVNSQVEKLVRTCIKEFGRIDILVNNASILGATGLALDLSDKDWQRVINVNLSGAYYCARAVARQMIKQEQGGKIVNIASINAKVAQPGIVGYVASKFGVIGLTQTLALELAPHGINVNAVCPGYILTDIGRGARVRSAVRGGASLQDAMTGIYASVLPQIPLGRVGQPADIAKAVAFLASSESDYITGQALNVCGGFLMAH